MNNKMQKMDILKNAGLYLVTSSEYSTRSTLETIEIALQSGCKLFQLREKNLSRKDFYDLAVQAKKIADKYNAVFIINDYIDVAFHVGADGVHLGQNDFSVSLAKEMFGERLIIGASTHNKEEIIKAQQDGADYINIGPVFPTDTKKLTNCISKDGVCELLPYVKIPFTLMGGIKESNIKDLKIFKPAAFAMVTEITMAANIKIKINNLFNSIYSFNSLC